MWVVEAAEGRGIHPVFNLLEGLVAAGQEGLLLE